MAAPMHAARCQSCHYDMTGLPLARCPECGGTAFVTGHPMPTPLQLACWAMPVYTCAFIGIQLAATSVSLASGCDGFSGDLLAISLGDHSCPPRPIFKIASFVVTGAPLIPAILTACVPRLRSLGLSLVAMLLGQLGIVALCLRWEHGSGEVLSSTAMTALGCGVIASIVMWCIAAGATSPGCDHAARKAAAASGR